MPKTEPGPYTVTATMWAGRECRRGHDLTGHDTITISGKTRRCTQCRIDDGVYGVRTLPDGSVRMTRSINGKCSRGLHDLVPGDGRCAPCRRTAQNERLAALKKGPVLVLIVDMPPAEVLANAACGLVSATLFDPLTTEDQSSPERYAVAMDRLEQAKAVCSACPVAAACLADALERRRLGVYGGRYLSPKSHQVGRIKRPRNTPTLDAARQEKIPSPPAVKVGHPKGQAHKMRAMEDRQIKRVI